MPRQRRQCPIHILTAITVFILQPWLRCSGQELGQQPNVVFLLADDLGWRDLSCYGSPFCETPNIDALAANGMRFTRAYTAASICSPTRASLMTGKHPVRTGITDYIPGLKSTADQMRTPRTATQLGLEEVTVGEMFSQHGYGTFYAGKWHLGNKGFEPKDQGFDVYVSDAQLGNHGRDWAVGTRITDAFDRYVAERESNKPFFAYLAFHEPHIPILKYPAHIDSFEDKARQLGASPSPRPEHYGLTRARQDFADYGSEVAGLDELVGNVRKSLEKAGAAENTIIVFMSDNGGLSTKAAPGPTNNDPLRAGKGWLYEGGIRVPLIVSMPGKIAANTVSTQMVQSFDLVPTLLELAGLPLQPQSHVDGRSVTPVLLGQVNELPPRTEFWHYPHYHGSTWCPGAAIREGDWKLIQFDHFATVELYNLADDPSESNDLSAAEPDRVAEMQSQLAAWQAERGVTFATAKNMEPSELIAWCLVPFDASKRNPEERAAMLHELGFRHFAYDWRDEHIPTWDQELDALQRHGIELTAFWCSSSLDPIHDPKTQQIVDFLRRRRVATQLWIMLPDQQLMRTENVDQRMDQAAEALRTLAQQVEPLGCRVGLYNHGGWVGQPATMVGIMERLHDLPNVGIVYNFHHSHEDLADFPGALRAMKPYLMCLNLNGTSPEGPKIQTIGEGSLDRQILSWIRQAQYTGPIGILDHREQMDARESLQLNLQGLSRLLGPTE